MRDGRPLTDILSGRNWKDEDEEDDEEDEDEDEEDAGKRFLRNLSKLRSRCEADLDHLLL